MNCCYKCERRTAECHSNCVDYLEYRKQKDKENAEQRKQIDFKSALNNDTKGRYRRMKNAKIKFPTGNRG